VPARVEHQYRLLARPDGDPGSLAAVRHPPGLLSHAIGAETEQRVNHLRSDLPAPAVDPVLGRGLHREQIVGCFEGVE
jgi:hypothetical protein